MSAPEIRPYILCVESDPAVREALLSAAEDRMHLRFEEKLTDLLAARCWRGTIPPVRTAIVEVPEPDLATVANLARLREANPGLPVLLTIRYSAAFQLAADRLEEIATGIVFRPFDAAAVLTTLRGLVLQGAK